jgi:hypothetical protein
MTLTFPGYPWRVWKEENGNAGRATLISAKPQIPSTSANALRSTRSAPTRPVRTAGPFGDLRVRALAGAIAAMLFTVTGITNKTLRGLMTGLLHRPCSMNQASYDLARLAGNGLIERVPYRTRYTLTRYTLTRYTLTRDGLLFACFYTRVCDHVLRPLMTPDRPGAPPELTAALGTLDELVAGHITRARVPTAA